jgi:hypothetical protein
MIQRTGVVGEGVDVVMFRNVENKKKSKAIPVTGRGGL